MKHLIVTLHHDRVFVPNPLKYVLESTMIINDTQFEEMPISELFDVIDRLVISPTKRLYYVVPGTTLTRGIREITSDDDMVKFVKVGFENGFKVDMYHEYNDYDVMAYTTNDNLFPNEDDNLGMGRGLIEHYERIWKYKQAVLESNPRSTCHLEVSFNDDGQPVFQRIHVCFKGIKNEWIARCRKVIGIDGCFITHMCKGEILTAMGRDGNNQMYPIAWAIVDVENKNNWCWFLSLLGDDLDLQEGLGVTIISDHHKVVMGATASTSEQDFKRYNRSDSKSCASFENGISKSFNAQILDARVAAFLHFKLNLNDGVSSWYTQSKWFDTYQFSIKPVYGSKIWKQTQNTLPLPPILKRMSGRPRKNRIPHPTEEVNKHSISRVGRVITCQNCQKTGHNKASCKDPKAPKPPLNPSQRKRHPITQRNKSERIAKKRKLTFQRHGFGGSPSKPFSI
ncbi:hypothetical protein Tco_0619764 [Tanacetum coccineum]